MMCTRTFRKHDEHTGLFWDQDNNREEMEDYCRRSVIRTGSISAGVLEAS